MPDDRPMAIMWILLASFVVAGVYFLIVNPDHAVTHAELGVMVLVIGILGALVLPEGRHSKRK
jgi:uncharacterized MnhB-related membrane protein